MDIATYEQAQGIAHTTDFDIKNELKDFDEFLMFSNWDDEVCDITMHTQIQACKCDEGANAKTRKLRTINIKRRRNDVSRQIANIRERSRMRTLSKAFRSLKNSLPWVPPDTRLSKLETLKLACSYIEHLKTVLSIDETQASSWCANY